MYRSVLSLLLAAGVSPALAQDVVQPGEEARKEAEAADEHQPGEGASGRYQNAYEAPAIEVHGKKALREEERIGSYGQPRWTSRRRFPTTRIYVVPEGHFAAEFWNRTTANLDALDKSAEKQFRNLYEFEFGLGHRLQLDVYLVTQQEGAGPNEIHKESIELRYALADWGEIWGNPTLYFEGGRAGGDGGFVEGKLLLGGELAEGWHGGLNLVWEHVLSGDLTNEYKLTAGISRTISDSRFSFGAEAEVELVDVKDERFDFLERKFVAGPSLSWQPSHNMHLLLAPLFGIAQEKAGEDSENTPILQSWFVVGWDY